MTENKKNTDWDFIMTGNDYQIAQKLLEVYKSGDYEELGKALEAYLQSSMQDARLELYHELSELFILIISWFNDNKTKTQENWEEIIKHRRNLSDLQEEYDFFNDEVIKAEWNDAFNTAKETLSSIYDNISEPTWNEVFEENYKVEDNVE